MVVIYREQNCAKNYAKLHNKIISKNLHLTCRYGQTITVIAGCLIKISTDNLSLKLLKIFALRMNQFCQICETALCRPNCIDSTQFCAGYGALSAEWFAIFKVSFTSNETFLLNKS